MEFNNIEHLQQTLTPLRSLKTKEVYDPKADFTIKGQLKGGPGSIVGRAGDGLIIWTDEPKTMEFVPSDQMPNQRRLAAKDKEKAEAKS